MNTEKPYQFSSTSHDFLRGNQQAYKRECIPTVYTKIKFSFRKLRHKASKIPLKLIFPRKEAKKKLFFFSLLHSLFENLYFIYFCSFYVAKLNLFLDLLHTKSGFMKHFTHFNLLYIT